MENDEALLSRFEATSRAQSRYLYLLAVALVLFLVIDSNVQKDLGNADRSINVPGMGIDLETRVLWQASPTVIGVLIMAILGALQAATSAWEAIRTRPALKDAVWEHMDTAPNLIDFAVFTTRKTPRVARCLALLAYPAFLTIAWLESLRIAQRVARNPQVALHSGLVIASFTLVSIPVVWRLLLLWTKKLKAIRDLWC